MREAFGPYTSHDLQPMREPRAPWRLADLITACIAIGVLALIAAGVI